MMLIRKYNHEKIYNIKKSYCVLGIFIDVFSNGCNLGQKSNVVEAKWRWI